MSDWHRRDIADVLRELRTDPETGLASAEAAGLEEIARNPSAQNRIFIPMIVGLAPIESLVIHALVIKGHQHSLTQA